MTVVVQKYEKQRELQEQAMHRTPINKVNLMKMEKITETSKLVVNVCQ